MGVDILGIDIPALPPSFIITPMLYAPVEIFYSCLIIDDKQCIVKIKQLTPVQKPLEHFFNCSNFILCTIIY